MPQLSRRIVIAQTASLLAVLAVVLPMEIEHWRTSQLPGANWFFGIYDTTIPLLLIVALPYFWFVRPPVFVAGQSLVGTAQDVVAIRCEKLRRLVRCNRRSRDRGDVVVRERQHLAFGNPLG